MAPRPCHFEVRFTALVSIGAGARASTKVERVPTGRECTHTLPSALAPVGTLAFRFNASFCVAAASG